MDLVLCEYDLHILPVYRFCRVLRSTFRRNDDESSNLVMSAAMERHGAFYHVGRALYEAADYFGKIMNSKDRVYHGLSQKMQFNSITEYFNAPTSTTKARSVGMFKLWYMLNDFV